jgi:anaerobic ribonucleoside-triphosphate reductase activating protein
MLPRWFRMMLHVANRITRTTVEGPFERYALWVSGCQIRCPGCCNPELFDQGRGAGTPTETLAEDIIRAQRQHDLEGLTVVGGEPLDQITALTALCQTLRRRAPSLGILVFTGYELASLPDSAALRSLLTVVDTVVDGPFDARLKEPPGGRRYLGSTNQGLRHQTPRYADPRLWRGPNSAEIHLRPDGRVQACGHPDHVRVALRALRTPAG